MLASHVRRTGLALLTVFLLQPINPAAAEGLPAAVKAADAKYLAAPDVTPKNDSAKIEAGGGEDEGAKPKPREVEKDAVKAALTYRAVDSEGETFFAPTIAVFAGGKEVAKFAQIDDDAFPSPYLSIQIAGARPRQYPSGGGGVLLYGRRALLLRHERDHEQQRRVGLDHRGCRAVRPQSIDGRGYRRRRTLRVRNPRQRLSL